MLIKSETAGRVIDSDLLKRKVVEWGATLVGIGDISTGLVPEFSRIPVAISIAVKHPDGRGRLQAGHLRAYSNQFADVDELLESIQNRIATLLKTRGWRTLAIPPDSAKPDGRFVSILYSLFPHKTAATCSGLGWIGKSGLLVTPEYGPRLSWATVLTDAPLEVCPTPSTKSQCGNCCQCVRACPASAIRNINWKRTGTTALFIDVKACAAYLKYSAQYFHQYICGLCVLACPLGAPKHLRPVRAQETSSPSEGSPEH
jgi:epoxyqueuosine reductase